MTPEQAASYVFAQSVAALCEIEGAKAANETRRRNGLADAYDDAAFAGIIDRYGLGHNAVVGLFQEVNNR